ncbi:MAG: cold shock domain-containing protein [Pseudolabrys sp.]
MTEEAEQGAVGFWNGNSFGFIRADRGGSDVFFHVTELNGQHVKRGDRVTYNIAPDQRNPTKFRAVQVQVR